MSQLQSLKRPEAYQEVISEEQHHYSRSLVHSTDELRDYLMRASEGGRLTSTNYSVSDTETV